MPGMGCFFVLKGCSLSHFEASFFKIFLHFLPIDSLLNRRQPLEAQVPKAISLIVVIEETFYHHRDIVLLTCECSFLPSKILLPTCSHSSSVEASAEQKNFVHNAGNINIII